MKSFGYYFIDKARLYDIFIVVILEYEVHSFNFLYN